MSKVVVIKLVGNDPASKLGQKEYRVMLETGLLRLAGKQDLKAAIRQYIPGGTVGMKANCLTGKGFSTCVELTMALSEILTAAGIKENNQIIWERTNRELADAGFELNASSFGVRCFGTDANDVGYGERIHISNDVNSLVSRILTEQVDHSISLPVLKDHSLAGLSGGMKNMYGAINNPNKYHDNNCSPFVADVCALEPIRSRHRLTIMDAVRVQYHGGPGYMPAYFAPYGGIIMSDDPVAADCISLEILERVRARKKLPTLGEDGRPVLWLHEAGAKGLGTAKRDLIDLAVIEVDREGNASEGSLF